MLQNPSSSYPAKEPVYDLANRQNRPLLNLVAQAQSQGGNLLTQGGNSLAQGASSLIQAATALKPGGLFGQLLGYQIMQFRGKIRPV